LAAADFFSGGDTTLLARAGYNGDVTYRYFEAYYQKARWIFPDFGYVDFGSATRYRETWIGGGIAPYNTNHFIFIAETFVSQATGPLSGAALYAQPWFYFGLKPAHHVAGEAVYFMYVPLSGQSVFQQVVERVKLEYVLHNMKTGVGYGAYGMQGGPWQNRPFVTTTLPLPRFGTIELWAQHLDSPQNPHRWQIQVRYAVKLHK
jgi:hypothetical protein